ncbi:MAG: hypothetical protein ACD_3C00086G0024 [uncultured bacterium (gcode 4)]|uniref:SbsA Ig-like domain-containing protein n=1 Tax=uncultured bacterium (gcode 4) TaxID=1234023 RepID=K2GXP1_9BACT|nr:MAG: hypothetical protein ACD_3C00086G0024 [uncultured bacterium (gcode 4)]
MSNAILSKFNKYHLIKATLIMLSFTVFFVWDAFADTNENCIVTMNTRCTFSDWWYLDITGVETNSTFVRYISKTGETIGQTQLNPFGWACMLPTRYGTRLLPSSHSFTSILDGKNTINIQADVEVYYYSFANLWTCQRQFSIPWSYQTSPVYTFTEKSSLSLLSSDPIDSATQVPIDSPITLDFSEWIDSTSIKDNISLTLNGNQIEYWFSQSDDKKGINIKLTSWRFAQNKIYALTIWKNLKDISWNTLWTDKVISFTTEVMPYSLSQQINSPQMEEEPHDVYLWEKIWKFQSGSGIILSAIVDNSFWKNLNLDFEVYKLWESLPIYKRSTEVNLWIWTVVVDFLWAWDYYWRVRTSDDSWNSSDWADFWMNLFWESDFSYFYWFEPYPYGYRFPNASVADWVLNWMWLSSIVRWIPPNSFLINQPTIIDWNKWNLFNNAFDTSTLKNDDRKMIDAFESLWLNTDEQFQWWNCYGMAMSPAMQFTHSGFIQTNYSKFSNQIWNWTIWDNIIPLDVDWKDDWNNYDGNKTLEIILSFQLSQSSVHIQKAIHNGTKSPDKILTELKNNSNNTYALLFWWKDKNNDDVWHAVIPYKVEWNRIYVWDNNFQYPFREINNTEIYSYNQYIELYTGSDWKIKWKDKTYEWNEFTEMSLVNLDDIYNNWYKSVPMWFNWNGTSYTLSWSSSIYISDSLWRVSWFTSSGVIEDIPWVDVIVPLNVTLSWATKSNLKQIYIPEKIDWLTIKVSWIKEENYDLKIAWWDYYTNISWVNTLTGQIDIFTTTNSWIFIDFDDSKTWTYTLLTDNFQDTLTWTVFSPWIESIIQPQKYIFDWNKVMQGSTNAISYQIDIDNDWIYDLTSNFSPVPKSLDEKWSISGYVKWDTNASMAWWKVFIDKNDNWKLEEYSEIFTTTDNKWYYRFDNLEKWNYNIAEIPHQNWNLIKPTNYKYNLYLNNWQNVINLDFVNTFTKWKGK